MLVCTLQSTAIATPRAALGAHLKTTHVWQSSSFHCSYRIGISRSDGSNQQQPTEPRKWERFWLEAEEVQQLMRDEKRTEDELLQGLISSASSLARPPISSFHVG